MLRGKLKQEQKLLLASYYVNRGECYEFFIWPFARPLQKQRDPTSTGLARFAEEADLGPMSLMGVLQLH